MRYRSFRPLRHIEDALERVIEGPVGVLFRNKVQPADVYRALEKELVAQSVPSHGRSIVPNAFTVEMNPDDMATFDTFGDSIESHLQELLEETASQSNLVFLGPVSVELVPNADQSPRNFTVSSNTSSRQADPPPVDHPSFETESFAISQITEPAIAFSLVIGASLTGGIAHPLVKRRTALGRSLDNDIVIATPDISRHHALIEVVDGVARIIDLNSLNGTYVNAVLVADWSIVKHRDRLEFGKQSAWVIREAVQ